MLLPSVFYNPAQVDNLLHTSLVICTYPAVTVLSLPHLSFVFPCYYLTYYRNFHPNAEHGVAEWADVAKTAKKLYGKGEEPVTLLSKNIRVNAKALPNMHILILGGSGDGKTTSLLIPNILQNRNNGHISASYLSQKRFAV